jgi:archaellin
MFRSTFLRTVVSTAAALAAVAIGTGGVVSATSASATQAGATTSATSLTVSHAVSPNTLHWY